MHVTPDFLEDVCCKVRLCVTDLCTWGGMLELVCCISWGGGGRWAYVMGC